MIADGGGGASSFSLDVDPGPVHDAASDLTRLAQGLSDEQSTLSGIAGSLAPVWRGANAEAIGGSVGQLAHRLGRGVEELTHAATALRTLATEYEHAKEQVGRLEHRRQEVENTYDAAVRQHASSLAASRTSPTVGPPTPDETAHDQAAASHAASLDLAAEQTRDSTVSTLTTQYVDLLDRVRTATRTAGHALQAAVLIAPPAPSSDSGGSDEDDPTEWADKLNHLLGFPLSPIAVALAGPEGRALSTLAGALRNGHGLPSELQTLFSHMVGAKGLAFDRGEISLADLVAADARYEEVAAGLTGRSAAAVEAATKAAGLGGLPEMPIFDAAGRLLGVVAIGSDVLTLINPGADGAEGDVNRAMAAANIAGTATALLAVNASVDWIPVAGQVVAVVSGVYLAGDWAYHTFKPFHDLVNDAGHGISVAAHATVHGIGVAVHYAEPWHW